jgi:hypothetical protein
VITGECIDKARSELQQFFAAQNEIVTAHRDGRLGRLPFLTKAKALRDKLMKRCYWAHLALTQGYTLCGLLDIDSTIHRERAAFMMLDTYAKLAGLE